MILNLIYKIYIICFPWKRKLFYPHFYSFSVIHHFHPTSRSSFSLSLGCEKKITFSSKIVCSSVWKLFPKKKLSNCIGIGLHLMCIDVSAKLFFFAFIFDIFIVLFFHTLKCNENFSFILIELINVSIIEELWRIATTGRSLWRKKLSDDQIRKAIASEEGRKKGNWPTHEHKRMKRRCRESKKERESERTDVCIFLYTNVCAAYTLFVCFPLHTQYSFDAVLLLRCVCT